MKKNGFISFIKNNRIVWVITLVMTLIMHGSMMLGSEIGIDTEALMYYGTDFYQGWRNSGRQGLVLTKMLLFGGKFNPYAEGILTLIFMTGVCIAWTYLFSRVLRTDRPCSNLLFSLIIATHTILTEQVYFKIQSAEIMLGLILCAISILILYTVLVPVKVKDAAEEKNDRNPAKWIVILKITAVILINVLIFSMYQVMMPLYIFGCVSVIFLHCVISPCLDENAGSEAHPWLLSTKFAIVFILSFVINELITMMFFNGSSYLGDQISWGRLPFMQCIRQIISHIARAGVLGRRLYFAPTYFFMAVMLVVMTFAAVKKKTDGSRKQLLFPIVLDMFLLMAPFYMTFICGGEVVIRSQLVLPFTLAFMAYIITLYSYGEKGTKKRKLWNVLALALCIITITEQGIYTLRLDYTDRTRYDSDRKLAEELIAGIDEFENEKGDIPVVFIGSREYVPDSLGIDNGDVIGYSFFDWDTDAEPYSYHSTLRIIGFMSTLGTVYTEPDTAKMDEAYTFSEEMAVYPEAGSIQKYDDMIIVKLGEKEEQ